MDTVFDIQKILDKLPHRYPFILVDRVTEIVPGEKIVALKNVTINEPFFQGHFPGLPIMPGVLILEALAQAGGLVYLESIGESAKNTLFYFMAIDKARFRKPVVPGDQLVFHIQMLKARAKAVKMAGRAEVDEQLVAEAEMMAAIGEKT